MKYFVDIEEEKHYYQNQAKIYQTLLDTAKKTIDVIKNFDGKLVNIKLEKALKEIVADTEVHIRINSLQIELNYIKGFPSFKQNQWYYPEDGWLRIKLRTDNTRRLQATETIDEVLKTIKNHTESLNKLLRTIDNLEILKAEYKEICDRITEFNHKYHYIAINNYKFDRVS